MLLSSLRWPFSAAQAAPLLSHAPKDEVPIPFKLAPILHEGPTFNEQYLGFVCYSKQSCLILHSKQHRSLTRFLLLNYCINIQRITAALLFFKHLKIQFRCEHYIKNTSSVPNNHADFQAKGSYCTREEALKMQSLQNTKKILSLELRLIIMPDQYRCLSMLYQLDNRTTKRE